MRLRIEEETTMVQTEIPALEGTDEVWDIETEEEELEYLEHGGFEHVVQSIEASSDAYYSNYLSWWELVSNHA